MSNLAAIAAIAAHLMAFHNGVCYQSCRSEGFHTGRFVYQKKEAYCDCTTRMHYEDMTARPFTLQMKSKSKQGNQQYRNDEYEDEAPKLKFDLFNGPYYSEE